MMISRQPRKGPSDVVDLLLECHGRIRTFTRLARDLGNAGDAPAADVADAATRIHRYFAEALPLHVQDEDVSLSPLLRGLADEIDDALATMTREHREHEEPLGALLSLCAELRATPARLSQRAGELRDLAARLERELGAHLDREERILFPAVRDRLAPALRDRLLEEVRARRRR